MLSQAVLDIAKKTNLDVGLQVWKRQLAKLARTIRELAMSEKQCLGKATLTLVLSQC